MKKLHDGKKIVFGLIIFLLLFFSPIWYNVISGGFSLKVELEVERDGKKCVRDTLFMKRNHMELLFELRDRVVREGIKELKTEYGEVVLFSLSGTCLGCHKNKDRFCDRCHSYLGTYPNCFSCHFVPKEGT